jgi:exodeoxyribonuclease VII small subunit
MKNNRNYSEMMNELQELLSALQSGDVDIDEALEKYRRGQILVGELEEYLQKAENTITHRNLEAAKKLN